MKDGHVVIISRVIKSDPATVAPARHIKEQIADLITLHLRRWLPGRCTLIH